MCLSAVCVRGQARMSPEAGPAPLGAGLRAAGRVRKLPGAALSSGRGEWVGGPSRELAQPTSGTRRPARRARNGPASSSRLGAWRIGEDPGPRERPPRPRLGLGGARWPCAPARRGAEARDTCTPGWWRRGAPCRRPRTGDGGGASSAHGTGSEGAGRGEDFRSLFAGLGPPPGRAIVKAAWE
ncbi:uncharacterized protein LOC111813710 [Octodon degus]|uniref:Uncharacterized protein LOC111813710 n=1 Tax=Octodon degus TaxID=10160 RepID=A0A6P6DLU3_OCTDE|nr:uncharacterized protein LOC111813710 [Octodon degus]